MTGNADGRNHRGEGGRWLKSAEAGPVLLHGHKVHPSQRSMHTTSRTTSTVGKTESISANHRSREGPCQSTGTRTISGIIARPALTNASIDPRRGSETGIASGANATQASTSSDSQPAVARRTEGQCVGQVAVISWPNASACQWRPPRGSQVINRRRGAAIRCNA